MSARQESHRAQPRDNRRFGWALALLALLLYAATAWRWTQGF